MCTYEFSVALQDTAVGHFSLGTGAGTGLNLTVTARPQRRDARDDTGADATAWILLKTGKSLVAEGLRACAPPEKDIGVHHKGTIGGGRIAGIQARNSKHE